MFYHFTIEDILEIHRMVLEESGEEDLDDVLNWSDLRNAVDSPKRVVFGTEIYPDPIVR